MNENKMGSTIRGLHCLSELFKTKFERLKRGAFLCVQPGCDIDTSDKAHLDLSKLT